MTSPPPPPVEPALRRRRRWKRSLLRIGGMLVAAFALLNVILFNHAHSSTHYTPAGEPPPKPEAMSRWHKLKVAFTGVAMPRPANHATPESVGLKFATHTIDLPGGERLSLWLIEPPSPRGTVVLGHGYMASKSSLLAEAKAFHALGWECVLVDFRGSGDSSGDTTTIGVTEAADVAEVAHWAKARTPARPLVLHGFSMGAAAVLRAVAVHGVAPDGIVLEAPFDRMLNAVRGRFRAMGVPSWPHAELMLFWGGVQLDFDGFSHNPEEYAASVMCPALVLHGSVDPRAPTEVVRSVYDPLPGSKRIVAFEGAGHESFARRDPDLWKAEVGKFLEQIVTNSAK